MEATQWDPSDDDLMDELREAVKPARSVPHQLVDAAKSALTWRAIDVELEVITLYYDSSLVQTADVRSAQPTNPRTLVFASETLTLELEVGADVLMGQVVPPRTGRVVLENPDGTVYETEADDNGGFLLGRPPSCPVRLRRLTDQTQVVTEWVPI